MTLYGFGSFDSYGYQAGQRLNRFVDSIEIKTGDFTNPIQLGELLCLDIEVSSPSVPLSNARIDVYSALSSQPLEHLYANVLGEAQYCYSAAETGIDTITFSSFSATTELEVEWIYNVGVVDIAPAIVSSPVENALIEKEYNYRVIGVDANENDDLSYQLIEGPIGMVMIDQELNWTPTIAQVGNFNVTVEVEDSSGLSTQQNFTIQSDIGNRAPVIQTEPTNLDVYVGYSYFERLTFEDPDGDNVYCEILDNPLTGRKSLELIPNACFSIFTFTPLLESVGEQAVTLRLWDRRGGETLRTYLFNVRENNSPQIVSLPVQYAKVGVPYASQLVAIDPDGDDLRYAITGVRYIDVSPALNAAPENLTIDPQNGRNHIRPFG